MLCLGVIHSDRLVGTGSDIVRDWSSDMCVRGVVNVDTQQMPTFYN